MAGCKRPNGFTLIEMLIAMTLLGIMVVLLFSSLKIAAESWNAGEGKIVEVNKKAVVYQFFKRHLTTIRPMLMPAGLRIPKWRIAARNRLSGQRRRLAFVASLPASAGPQRLTGV